MLEEISKMKTTKENFFTLLCRANFNGKKQIRDIMPSAASIKFENQRCKTTWECQNNRGFVFGWTISEGMETEYYLNFYD